MARFWHNFPGNGLGSTGQREIAHGLGPDYILTPPPVPPTPEPLEPVSLTFPGPQQGDVLLFQTNNDGDINVQDGLVEMSEGLDTSSYLSMFGGDEDGLQWWGNLLETEPDRQYNSETQRLLDILPATSGNLRKIEDAARQDLEWLSGLTGVAASIPAVGRIGIEITLDIDGAGNALEFVEMWEPKAAAGGGESLPAPATPVFISTPVSDVNLFQTIDDGNITIEDGLVELSGSLETAVYLSLFGGDEDGLQWWGNFLETDLARQYNSETQELLDTISATSENLLRLEDAARRDLSWLISGGEAASIEVSTFIPSIGRVNIALDIETEGALNRFNFVEIWEAV